MLTGINTQLPNWGRRAPLYQVSNGGILFFNPLAYRGVPITMLLNTTGITLKQMCTPPPGVYVFNLLQDSSGSRTITTYPAAWRWMSGGTVPTLTTTANKIDVVTLECDGLYQLVTCNTNG